MAAFVSGLRLLSIYPICLLPLFVVTVLSTSFTKNEPSTRNNNQKPHTNSRGKHRRRRRLDRRKRILDRCNCWHDCPTASIYTKEQESTNQSINIDTGASEPIGNPSNSGMRGLLLATIQRGSIARSII